MNQLGAEARALLRAARQGDEPHTTHRARVRARLAAGILAASCAGEVAGATKSASAASAAPAGATAAKTTLLTTVFAKAIASVVVLGAVAVGASEYLHSRPLSAGHRPPLRAVDSAAIAHATADAPRLSPPMQPPTSGPALEPSAAPSQSQSPPPVRPAAASHRGARALDIEAELRILREIHASLQAGDPARALALLDEQERRFPSGALLEERESTRPVVLCAIGRVADARQAAARFLRNYPESPQATRVRSVCTTPPVSNATF